MGTTTNLGLSTFDTASGSATKFLDFRLALAGNSSNMTILDTFAGNVSGSLTTLQSNSIYNIAANQIYSNYYEATIAGITSYTTGMIVCLKVDATNTGQTSININSIGVTYLKKINSSGLVTDLVAGDLAINKYYFFTYNGLYFVFVTPYITYSGSSLITISGSMINHALSSATTGSYNAVQIDQYGHVISGSNIYYSSIITGSGIMSDTTGSIVKHNVSGVVSGSYNQILVDQYGHVTAGSVITTTSGSISGSGIMSDTAGSVVKHNNSTVSPGSYLSANITIDQYGHITSAANGTSASSVGAPSDSPFVTSGSNGNLTNYNILTAGSNITITTASYSGGPITIHSSASAGLATISGSSVMSDTTGSVVKHNTSIATPGSYTSANITIDSYGHITAASNGTSGSSGGGITTSSGSYASLPTSASAGNLYFPTDGYQILRDTGSVWESWGPIYKIKPPVLSNFTAVNQSSASFIESGGTVYMKDVVTSGVSWRILKKSAPSTPYTVTMGFIANAKKVDYNRNAILFRESSTGKMVLLQLLHHTYHRMVLETWADTTTYNGTISFFETYNVTGHDTMFFRITDDGSNRIYSVSFDGHNFDTLYTEGRTTYFTADEIGFAIASQNASYASAMTVFSWSET